MKGSLAPGFRFHPTDEELVWYYLRRKASGKAFRLDPISDVDIYKMEPWDLPAMAKLKTRDLQWYFFSALDRKYVNGSRTNRATLKGYWKTTGKDRPVRHNSLTVGMKKTLVFHRGRAPKGQRSNWVMHEYSLAHQPQDAIVLCRIFQKSGSGPKNGEQYGAPFLDEEWDDAFVPAEQLPLPSPPDEFVYDDSISTGQDVYVQVNQAGQPLNFYYGETSDHAENSGDHAEYDQKPVIGSIETQCGSDLRDDQNFVDLPEHYEKTIKEEYFVESNDNVDSVDVNYLLDEPYLDASENNLTFLETNDLSKPNESDPAGFSMVEDYLAFFDAVDDNITSDPSQLVENENPVTEQSALTPTDVNGANDPVFMGSQKSAKAQCHNDASSSMQNPETPKFGSDVTYPFMKRASQMLGPAFASDFSKDAALRFNQGQASSSVHVTAGIIRIRNVTLTGNEMHWSFGKNWDLNIIFSFDLHSDAPPASLTTSPIFPGKIESEVPRSWFYLMFIWILILLSVSFKIGSYIHTR